MRGLISVKGIIEASKDPNMRVFATKQGAYKGDKQLVGGDSVAWKGLKGIKGQGPSEQLKQVAPRVAAGLNRAISISKAHREKGEALVLMPNKRWKYMPMKAAQMALEAGDISSGQIRAVGSDSLRRNRNMPQRRANREEIPFEGGTAGYPGEIQM